jgi:Zn-dependent protease
VGGIRIARVVGIPIYLHYTWFVVFGLVVWALASGYFPARYPDLPVSTYWAKGVIAALLLFASVLVHELGHSLVALRHGIGIASITLFIFGGVARLREDPKSPGVELRVAVAGPVTSLLLAALFLGLASAGWGGSGTVAVTSYVGRLNLILAVFNLVPALPLDGGRMLRAALWSYTSKVRATQIASGFGTFFAYFLMLNGLLVLVVRGDLGGLWLVFIGWFLKEAAAGAYQQARLDQAFTGLRVGDLLVADCRTLPGHLSVEAAVSDYFLRFGHGGFPVEEDGRLTGLVSLAEIKRVPREEWARTPVRAVMLPIGERTSVRADQDVIAALTQMAASGRGRLLVVDASKRCIGLVTHGGILRRLQVLEELAP